METIRMVGMKSIGGWTDGKKEKSQREKEKREETMLSFVQVYCFWFGLP